MIKNEKHPKIQQSSTKIMDQNHKGIMNNNKKTKKKKNLSLDTTDK